MAFYAVYLKEERLHEVHCDDLLQAKRLLIQAECKAQQEGAHFVPLAVRDENDKYLFQETNVPMATLRKIYPSGKEENA